MNDTRRLTESQVASPDGGGDILDLIVEGKRAEVAALRPREADFRARIADLPAPRDFGGALADPSGLSLVAEVKRRSPGAGAIDESLDPPVLARRYEAGGARAISVLTDGTHFGGSLEDLARVRGAVSLPCLRKDFTLEEVQVLEARAGGADAVLLIVRVLDDVRLRDLRELAESLGMAALVEAHDATEVERALASGARILGVNNRDLATFRMDLSVTFGVLERVPPHVTLVSESGVRTGADAERLAGAGVDAVLVGEALVRARDPEALARDLSRPVPASRPPSP